MNEDDFQDALDADPSDYFTRLVFADWLEERGDPRAAGYRALGCRSGYATYTATGYYIGGITYPQRWGWCDTFADQPTRREAEDAAALAFARLPPDRQAELLGQALEVAS